MYICEKGEVQPLKPPSSPHSSSSNISSVGTQRAWRELGEGKPFYIQDMLLLGLALSRRSILLYI
jgi:hypothetical protein